jgi:hypothetical protein
MGLDATIRHVDRKPMGESGEVQSVLVAVFPGVRFGSERYHRKQTFLAALLNLLPGVAQRRLREEGMQGYCGDYEGEGFSAQFKFPAGQVQQIDVDLYGDTDKVNPKFEQLRDLKGWEATYD